MASRHKPNAETYNPSPAYIRELVEQLRTREEFPSYAAIAVRIGVSRRSVDYWLSGEREIPYTAQYALEVLTL